MTEIHGELFHSESPMLSPTVEATAMVGGSSAWMMGGMAVIWILAFIALLLAIAALVKYLRSSGN
ncbi:hypothetical protein NKG99_07580 [Mesorhizobium sp. M1409]|uniref:hypothetical protein n=1 Tax=unclassified Mesorhizobium TaxID=325217 RepID=UPI003335B781